MNKQLRNCILHAFGWCKSNPKFFPFLCFLIVLLSPKFVFGITNPPKVVQQKSINNTNSDLSSTKPPEKDWLFATIEDEEDKGFVSCGFADNHKPSVVKMSPSLDFLFRDDFEDTEPIIDESGIVWTMVIDGSTRCTDLIQVGNYYYVSGFAKLKRLDPNFPPTMPYHYIYLEEKPLLFKYSKDLILQPNFPKTYGTNGWTSTTYTYSNSKSHRANGIAYDYSNDKIYLVGSTVGTVSGSDENFVWAAVIETTNYTITTQTDFSHIEGVYYGITPIYDHGSTYTKKPINGTDAPNQFAFCGRIATTRTGTFSNYTMADALITKCDGNLTSNIAHIQRDAPSSGYSLSYPRGAGVPTTCPTETAVRNSNDEASSIIQLPNGNFELAISIKYNIYLAKGNGYFNPGLNNPYCSQVGPIPAQDREQLLDCDAFILIVDKGFTNGSTTNLIQQHVAHLDGDDYQFIIKQTSNTSNEIIAIGTITVPDVSGDSEDEYWVFKYTPNFSTGNLSLNWERSYQGTSKSYCCGFSITPTYKGGILIAGNNGIAGDNYDWLLLGRDCETNIGFTGWDFGPNMIDGKTFSVQKDLAGTGLTTMSLWNPRTIHAQVRVETGFTLRLLSHGGGTGCELSFLNSEDFFDSAYNSEWQYGIIVEKGAVLEMQPNTLLTSNTGCGNTFWGGVLLENGTTTNAHDGGELTMIEATIENASTGVSVNNGGFIHCENNPVTVGRTSTINFKNCRRSVQLGWWTSSGSSWSYFKYANFLGDNPINEYNGAGIKDFISLWDFNGLNLYGCSFRNIYTGTYPDKSRGMGITSFNINAQILKGSNTFATSGSCTIPTGNSNLFEGLDIGIWNGGNSNSNQIFIQGNEFKNVANGIYAGTGKKLQLYDNDFYWDNNFLQPINGHPNHHVKAIHTANVDGLLFDQNRINAKLFISPFTGMYLENVNDVGVPSLIFKNKTWNDLGIGIFGTAMINSNGSNNALDLICNEYINMQQDWSIEGTGTTAFRTQVGNASIGNSNKWSKPYSGPSNIIKLYSPTIDYYSFKELDPLNPYTPNDLFPASGNVVRRHTIAERDCNPTDPCIRYLLDANGQYYAEVRVLRIPPYEEALDALNKGDFITARDKTNSIETYPENYQKIELLNILIPIFEQHRQFNMTTIEKEALTNLTIGYEPENEYARNVLTFFAGKKFKPSPKPNVNSTSNLSTAVPQTNKESFDYLLYPNPASNSIKIQFPNEINPENTIIFTNVMGVKVLELNNIASNQLIDLSAFANGMYIITITSKGQMVYTTMVSKI